jgi:hypothetical protein
VVVELTAVFALCAPSRFVSGPQFRAKTLCDCRTLASMAHIRP